MGYEDQSKAVTGAREAVTGGQAKGKVKGLFGEVRRVLRVNHYSKRTEAAYLGWIRRFVEENGRQSPRELGAVEVERFLSRLAEERQVAPGTQNQALAALLFLYRRVLQLELPWLDSMVRAKRARIRVPCTTGRSTCATLARTSS